MAVFNCHAQFSVFNCHVQRLILYVTLLVFYSVYELVVERLRLQRSFCGTIVIVQCVHSKQASVLRTRVVSCSTGYHIEGKNTDRMQVRFIKKSASLR